MEKVSITQGPTIVPQLIQAVPPATEQNRGSCHKPIDSVTVNPNIYTFTNPKEQIQ
jgi:hypothetical protein